MYQVILAQKKSRPVEAIRWNGNNTDQVLDFCSTAKINDNGDLVVSSLENDRVVNIGDFVIKGVSGEFYASTPESFFKNYYASILDDLNTADKPTTFMSRSKFVHTIQFHSDQFEDGVAFVKDSGLTGVELQRDMSSDTYKITHPTREAYEIKDGDNLIFDFKRLYPCDHDIFNDTYDTLGYELNDNYVPDEAHIFYAKEFDEITNLRDAYYYGKDVSDINKIVAANGRNGGIGIMSLLRIARHMMKLVDAQMLNDTGSSNENVKQAILSVETALDLLAVKSNK